MKVVVRNSSLLFFMMNVLLGLPVRRNRIVILDTADKEAPPPVLVTAGPR